MCAGGPQAPGPPRGGRGQGDNVTGLLLGEPSPWGVRGQSGSERCHSLAYSQCLRFRRGRRERGMHPGKERELQTATPSRILRGAAARPVMGIYFPPLCSLVPASVHQPVQPVSERLGNGAIRCTGMPSTVRGAAGCGHTLRSRPAQADMRFQTPPPHTHTHHAPCQVTLLPQEPTAWASFSLTPSQTPIAKRQRKGLAQGD